MQPPPASLQTRARRAREDRMLASSTLVSDAASLAAPNGECEMKIKASVFGWLVGALIAGPASGHVTLEGKQAPADSYYKAVLNVPHGCKESPTVRIRVRIPEGVISVKPQPKQGWKLAITR